MSLAGGAADLGRRVGAAGWSTLLPPHRALGADQPVGEPRLLDVLPMPGPMTLAVVEDGAGRCLPVPLVEQAAGVRRATPGDGASDALVGLLSGGTRREGRFHVTRWHHDQVTGERGVGVDQTNESVIVGDAAVVKWSVPAGEGPHPAPSLLAELDRAGFQGMPLPWGAVEWGASPAGGPRLLALVTGFVPGAVDGWTWAVDTVRGAVEAGDLWPAEAQRPDRRARSSPTSIAPSPPPPPRRPRSRWAPGAPAPSRTSSGLWP